MARGKVTSSKEASGDPQKDDIDDLTKSLISDLNKEFGLRVAYNLAETEAPTVVKRWIDTGSVQLNYAIRNAAGGGYPEGRIVEIAGQPSIGKSHLAYHAAANVQAAGGIVIYIDTENATPIEKLAQMGINIKRGFVYMDMHATEHVFKAMEETILKTRNLMKVKDVPVLIIWDSIAATSPLAELEGEYEKDTIGLQARAISKGMRKITGLIGQNAITLLCLNQLKTAIGVMHGDPEVTPGGRAVPFHSSVRIRLTSGSQVKDAKGNVIGIHVIATIKKNKLGPPFKKMEFDIIFGKGIQEHEYVFDELRSFCDKNEVVMDQAGAGGKRVKVALKGSSSWKELEVVDQGTGEVLVHKKFYKSGFGEIMSDPEYKPYVDHLIDTVYTLRYDSSIAAVDGDEEGEIDEEEGSE